MLSISSAAKKVPNRCNIRHHGSSRLHRLAESGNDDDDDRDSSSRVNGSLVTLIARDCLDHARIFGSLKLNCPGPISCTVSEPAGKASGCRLFMPGQNCCFAALQRALSCLQRACS